MGLLRVQVVEGRNIRSPELGLPGNVGCRVYWDPTRFMAAKQKKKFIAIDQSCSANHDIGTTNFVYAMNPVWDNMLESDVSRRLKLLMPNQGALFDSTQLSYEKRGIDFPILQPIGLNGDLQVLEPWDTTLGAVVVEIQFFDLLNLIPGSEYPIGEVVVPLREVVKLGGVTGWYSISESDPTTWKLRFDVEKEKGSDGSSLDTPQVFLKVTWDPPQDTGKGSLRDTEREASYAIQEEVVRSALLSRHQKEKFSLLVSSMGAFNSVRGISANLQMVQNSLGTLLDLCESVVHAFDFTVNTLRFEIPRQQSLLISIRLIQSFHRIHSSLFLFWGCCLLFGYCCLSFPCAQLLRSPD